MQNLARSVVLVMCTLAIAGCSLAAEDNAQTTSDWVEPGWMAQVRQQNEEYEASLISCFSEFGLEPVRIIGGGVGFVDIPDQMDALMESASAECYQRVAAPEHFQITDAATYQRMIETRNCIVAHGWDVPEPPSESVWLEQDERWYPYVALTEPPNPQIPAAELRVLMEACPQSGMGGLGVAPTEK
jgi:hypothetical protein